MLFCQKTFNNLQNKGDIMKKKIIGGLLALLLAVSPSLSMAQGFSDTQNSWAKRYIEYYQSAGIISGSGNNMFYPNNSVTANEFAIILGRVLSQKHPQLFAENEEKSSTTFASQFFSADNYLYHLERLGLLQGIALSPNFPSQKMNRSTADMILKNLATLLANQNNSADAKIGDDFQKPIANQNADNNSTAVNLSSDAKEKTNDSRDNNTDASAISAVDPSDQNAMDSSAKESHKDNLNSNQNPIANTNPSIVSLYRPNWYSEIGTLYSPSQLLTRSELLQILYHTFETQTLPYAHKVELPITHISQMTPVVAPVGCEPVSMLMCLRYKGFAKDVSIRQYLDALPRHKNDPEIAFAGSPYTPNEALRTTIFPSPLAKYGQSYGAQVVDISGSDVEQLKTELYNGNPIVVYVTLFWQKPYYKKYNIAGEVRTYLRNNHALVLAGYDPINRKFLMVDPYNVKGMKAKYWYDEDKFTTLYNARKHAVSIQ